MKVLVVYSLGPRQVTERELDMPPGSSIADLLQTLRESPLRDAPVGIWGRKQPTSTLLRDGDRVELYRPLRVDPKVARRERFVGQGARGAGLFSKKRPGAKAGY